MVSGGVLSAGEYGAVRRGELSAEGLGAEELRSGAESSAARPGRLGARAQALVLVASCSLALLAFAALQSGSPVVLEQEIGAFGTRLRQSQQTDIEDVYDNTFQGDPGHISRAEIRFNEALHSAGGRNHEHVYSSYSRSARMTRGGASLRSATDQWSAFPEGRSGHAKTQLTVNIKEEHKHQRAPPHRGMTAEEARSDLNSYFKSQDSQVKQLERRHAEHFLSALRESPREPRRASDREVSVQSRGRSTHGAREDRHSREMSRKQDSLMKLLRKAAQTKEFQRELVAATKDRYRTSLTADF